ncbi:hypothetical protein PV325_007278 [Microctonus aethiopoides]|nr:hypothetical protein PV325_007278 [Microctonus aethiopoides]
MFKHSIIFLIHGLLIVSSETQESCPTIKSRSQWSARESKSHNYLINPLPYVIIHHTVSPECNTFSSCSSRVRNIQDYHMDEFQWSDVGFSFFVGGDGNIYEGVGWTEEGAHTYRWNKKSIGVAFIGSYQAKNASEKMINVAHKLIECGIQLGMLRPNVKVIGASQVSSTKSPGEKLFQQIQQWPEWKSDP